MSKDVSSQTDITKAAFNAEDGSFKRVASSFRDVIEKGGKYEPEKDRYHLYASYSCPWATRTLIVRKLKGLEGIVPVTIASPRMGADGWSFASADDFPGAENDPLYGARHLKDLYLKCVPDYSGRFSVPVLWDKKNETIVNNESSEIIRMFNSAFNDLVDPEKAKVDIYPESLRKEIEELHEWAYPNISNGVYRAGFATSSEAYEAAVKQLFTSLDRLEKVLDGKDYIIGDQLTEADVRTYVTTIRFDPVYVSLFKCNIRDIRNGYPAINKWMKKLYWNNTAFKEATNFEHIKTGYYWSHPNINPTRIIPVGPVPLIEDL
ncbi:S-glutathionyl-(chloro)hydroquinone reductase [Marasmius tenuissimus]|uniref:S-glutathionyl-(Chloro)hydroquinone reductase n=1 Tax=Marasmius tenuissimus TaxID=585030 RepID=A0ABR3A0L3_9AGAR|nr:S-glutathionyl-(chloro)hydroquinone reductase [Marasmius tenuissimus]